MVWPAARPLLTITLSPSAPVAAAIARHSRGKSEPTCGGDLLGQLAQVGVVRLGHEQRVAVIDRVDVEERHGLRPSRGRGRRDLAVDDLAEDAVRIVR